MALVTLDKSENGVFVVRMQDEARRNALSDELADGVLEQLVLADSAGARAIVLTGAGPAFSAGGDLDGVEASIHHAYAHGKPTGDDMSHLYRKLLKIREIGAPVIAAVNGHAIGAGAALVLVCDMAVISSEARVGFTFIRLGIHPGLGATWFLPRIIGSQRAAEMLFTAETYSADELMRLGLGNRVVAPDLVESSAMEMAAQVANNGPLAVRRLKRALTQTWHTTVEAQIALEIDHQMSDFCSRDALEGVRAVRERRVPQFRGE